MVSKKLLELVKNKCYITDDNEITLSRLSNIIKISLTKIKRLIGVDEEFDFEEEGNEEELDLLLNSCWYDWNDASNEFKDNYLDDINSIRHKHEVSQYASEEEN